MKRIKDITAGKWVAIAAAGLLAFGAFVAHSQLGTGGQPISILGPLKLVQGGVGAWTNSIVGQISASNTVANGTGLDLSRARDVNLQFTAQASAADTDPIGIVLARNVDGSTNVQAWLRWDVTPAGTAYVTGCTNLSINSLGGMPARLYVLYITNATATAYITNYTLTANIK